MAEDNKAVVVVEVDLDDKKFNEDLRKLRASTSKSADAIQDNLNFKPEISFDKIFEQFKKIAQTVVAVGGTFLILQKKFGLFTRVFAKIGIDIDLIITKAEELLAVFIDFISGVSTFDDLKGAIGGLLVETGLLDSKVVALFKGFQAFQAVTIVVSDNLLNVATASTAAYVGIKSINDVTKVTRRGMKILLGSKGLFGLISSFGLVGGAAEILTRKLEDIDHPMAQLAASTTKTIAIIAGGFAAAMTFAIVKLTEYGTKVTSNIIDKNIEIAKSYQKVSQKILIFERVVANFNKITNGSSGSVSSWNKTIDKLSASFNFNIRTLQKSAQEIVAVTSQMGFNEKQMKKLLKISSEFAKVNGKDVFQTTLAIVSGLNGSSQALQAYGIKLNETAVLQNAFKDGLNESFNSLSQNEKSQLRYNKLLKTYKTIQGVAAEAADSFGDSVGRLSVRYTKLNERFAAGVNLVEELGIVAFTINKVLTLLNDTVVSTAGVIFALGARIINVTSILLGFSFTIFAAIKAFKLLKLIMETESAMKIFDSNIFIINKSLNEMIGGLTGTAFKIKDLSSLTKAASIIMVSSLNSISLAFFGLNLSALTFFGAMRGAILKLKVVIVTMAKAVYALLAPFALIIAVVAGIIGALIVLKNQIIELQEKTQIFTKFFALFGKETGRNVASVNVLSKAFGEMTKWVGDKLSKAFGVLLAAMLGTFSIMLLFAEKNPFNIFSKETVEGIKGVREEINKYGDKLIAAGFDTRKVTGDIKRSIASVIPVIKELNIQDLSQLEQEFKNFGKSQLTLLKEQLSSRQELINLAVDKGVRTSIAGNILLLQVQKDFEMKRALIGKEARDKLLADALAFTERFKDVGKTELQILSDKMKAELIKLEGFRKKNVISLLKYETTKKAILDKFTIDRATVIKKGVKTEKSALEDLNKNISSQLLNGAVNLVSSSMDMIGQSLDKGALSFESFGGTILSIIGDLLVSLGAAYIAIGFSTEALKDSVLGLTGGPAIAAGIALGLLGGVLKAAGARNTKAGGDSFASASVASPSGGGVASSGSSSGDFGGLATAQNEVESGPSTAVNLTIQGDVLDGDTSGLRIVELLNEAFETKGAVLSSDARFA